MTAATAVQHYLRPGPPTLGGERRLREGVLARDLMSISRKNGVYFRICFGAIVVLLAGAAIFVLTHLDAVGTIQTVFAVLGISVTGLTAQMTSLWKQKVNADFILVLARNVEKDQLEPLLRMLLDKM